MLQVMFVILVTFSVYSWIKRVSLLNTNYNTIFLINEISEIKENVNKTTMIRALSGYIFSYHS